MVLIGATVAVVFAVVCTAWAWRAVAALDRVALTAGNALFNATSAAVLFLEPGLLGDVLAERRLSTLRITRPRSFPTGRVRALLAAEVVRTLRNRRAFGCAAGRRCWWSTRRRWSCRPGGCPSPPCCARCRRCRRSGRGSGGSASRRRCAGCSAVPTARCGPCTWRCRQPLSVVFVLAVAPAVPSARWAALALIPIGVLVNLWTRTKGKPAVTADRVGDIGFGPIPIDLTWYYVREIAPLAITLALQLAI